MFIQTTTRHGQCLAFEVHTNGYPPSLLPVDAAVYTGMFVPDGSVIDIDGQRFVLEADFGALTPVEDSAIVLAPDAERLDLMSPQQPIRPPVPGRFRLHDGPPRRVKLVRTQRRTRAYGPKEA